MKLVIPIEPVEQQRPRIRKGGRGLYDPKKVRDFKKEVAEYVKQQDFSKFEDKALNVKIKFYRQVQNSISKKERELRLSDVHRPIVKPDLDNYTKSILDALNSVLWDDDAKIVHAELDKIYSEKPRIEIEVEEWSEQYGNARQETNHDVSAKRE